jgi:hypothetical protein
MPQLTASEIALRSADVACAQDVAGFGAGIWLLPAVLGCSETHVGSFTNVLSRIVPRRAEFVECMHRFNLRTAFVARLRIQLPLRRYAA